MTNTSRSVPSEGIHQKVPFETYLSWDAVNPSTVKLLKRTPAHALHSLTHPKPETDAQALGHALHASVLEPTFFDENYITSLRGQGEPGTKFCNKDGTLPRRSADQKMAWQEFEMKYRGYEIMSPGNYDYCLAMRKAAWRHPDIRMLLQQPGYAEVCIVWTDPDTGLLCKGRVDWLTTVDDLGIVADFKTTKAGDLEGFAKEIANFEMQIPAAMYLDGLNIIAPHPREFVWMTVENFGSFEPATYTPCDVTLEEGRWEYKRRLQLIKEAKASGKWHGYHHERRVISLPKWARKMEGR